MQTDILSDIELYYSKEFNVNEIIISEDEAHHALNVMRHKVGDFLYVTNGKGIISKARIEKITKKKIELSYIEQNYYEEKFSNIVFCLPHLKKNDKLEFALEKCVELGFTNFIIYDSDRTIAKGDKTNRWEKILTSAMKQSINSWLPKIQYKKNIEQITSLSGEKIFFEQKAEISFKDYLISKNHLSQKFENEIYYLIFGPEGGFSKKEINIINPFYKVRLTNQRLRSETAIITTAALISINTIQ